MRLILQRSKDTFSLIWEKDSKVDPNNQDSAKNNYTIELSDLRIKIERIETTEAIFRHLYKPGDNRIAITRNFIRSYDKTKGLSNLGMLNAIETKQLPEAVYIALVDMDAFQGDCQKNPFYFEYVPMTSASLIINGKHEPFRPYNTSSNGKRRREVYEDFLNNTGRDRWCSHAVNITCKEYYEGYHILAWDRTSARDNRWNRQIMSSGYVSINLMAETPIKKNYTIIVYATYSDFLDFDNKSNVSLQLVP